MRVAQREKACQQELKCMSELLEDEVDGVNNWGWMHFSDTPDLGMLHRDPSVLGLDSQGGSCKWSDRH